MSGPYKVAWLCEALLVSRSGYYDWVERRRQPSPRQLENIHLRERIRAEFSRSRQTYGSPRLNLIVEKYTYDAYGTPRITDAAGNSRTYPDGRPKSNIGNRFMYTGREFISELGIYDYRHRFYHPGIGRFIETDPIGLQTEGAKLTPEQRALFSPGGLAPEAFSSSELNLYRYCGDDPVNHSDPTGLEFTDRDVELVKGIPGMFGRTEFKLSAAVAPVQTNDGTYSLQVTKYNVAVTSKQVATTANGKERKPEAIGASKEHENLHTSDMKAVHDANQNKVLKTGYPTREAAAKDAQKQANKLNRDFGKAEAQTNRHQPDDKWKYILLRER